MTVLTFRLGDVAEQITDGTHLSPNYVDSGIPMLDSKHIKNDFSIDDSDAEKFISIETDKQLAQRCKPIAGDILISSRGTIGKIAIVKDGQNFNIMGNMILVRLGSSIDKRYFLHYLRRSLEYLVNLARGVAQKGLYLNQVRDLKITIPPLAEQQRIAALLDAADRILKQRESAISKLDQLSQSVFVNMFSEGNSNAIGWVISEFEDVVSDITKQFDKVDSNQYMSEGITPVIDQGADFICGYTNIVPSKKKQSQYHIIFGDHTRRLKFVDFDFILGADGTKVLLPKIEINIKYLFYYLSYLKIEEAGYSRHYKFLKRSMILLPPRNLQDKFASFVDVLEIKSKKMYEMKSQVAALISSLQHQSFSVN